MKNLMCHRATWTVLALTAAMAACSGTGLDRPSQVAATVNREEISVQQVVQMLQRHGDVTPTEVEAVSRQALESLVDTEVAVQAALDQRLDRDPAVKETLEAARREVLARAYAERLTQAIQAPTADEARQYYDRHSALFAKRRLYSLVDTTIEATPDEQATIEAKLGSTQNAGDVALLLRQSGVRHQVRRSTYGAEALPMQAVDAMAALNEGQSILVQAGHETHIYTVLEARMASLSFDDVRPAIEKVLAVEKRRTVVAQQIKTLRGASHIEYHGRYAEPATATVAWKAPSVLPEADSKPGLNAVALEQGVRALPSISVK